MYLRLLAEVYNKREKEISLKQLAAVWGGFAPCHPFLVFKGRGAGAPPRACAVGLIWRLPWEPPLVCFGLARGGLWARLQFL